MNLKEIVEAALFASPRPLTVEDLGHLFDDNERPAAEALSTALAELTRDYENRPVQLQPVASGYRFQVRAAFSPWVSRLFQEKPARYSRALFETLAIIAYRQPVTRGEIEEIRGVTVTSNIIRTLLERDWVSVVGHRELPGRPALYATTREFLNYFNLQSLDQLPPLMTFGQDEWPVSATLADASTVPSPEDVG
ncbi:MAG: SMC-Scp complex subunit ScpB [Methylotetracoccus sp.]|nr:SMC-Scp complex subunit ScpB [Methylotetracoccus sp.]